MSEELQPYKGKKGSGSKLALPMQTGDLVSFLNMAIDESVKRMGRPAVYPPDNQGLDNFVQKSIDYFEHVNAVNSNPDIQDKIIPDVESYAIFLGITRKTLLMYQRRGGIWDEVISQFKEVIVAAKKQLAFTYRIPPIFAVFDLVNNGDYYNTNEFKPVPVEIETRKNTPDDQARELGLVWDEVTGEYVPEGKKYDH